MVSNMTSGHIETNVFVNGSTLKHISLFQEQSSAPTLMKVLIQSIFAHTERPLSASGILLPFSEQGVHKVYFCSQRCYPGCDTFSFP